MIPLLTPPQIREGDAYTIAHEPISSLDLMERASNAFTEIFIKNYPDKGKAISIYCGTGNNGGDGLAIARLLKKHKYTVDVKIARFSEKSTGDFDANLKRLKGAGIGITEIKPGANLPNEQSSIIIDALLGSGLNKPLKDDYEKLVKYLNSLNAEVVAVDVPSGFYTEGEILPDATILKAHLVLTFQQPKINFLLPESAIAMDKFEVADIGIDAKYTVSLDSPYQLIAESDIRQLLKPRKQFVNKGTYGHALIIAGQQLTMGAALLCSSACAHTGAGLTTACIPESGLTALNTTHPEIMAEVRKTGKKPEIKWDKFNTIAIGPGLGTQPDSLALLKSVFKEFKNPVVIDADALNLLSENQSLYSKIPKGSIITPHMKEFDRLFGEHKTWWNRLETVKVKAKELGIYIVLKNSYTITGTPDGKLFFNPTGNPAMATGGMGDVLTGVIVSLLAQKYPPLEACIIGTYIHGKAGDDLALPHQRVVILAGQVANQISITLAN